MTRLLQSCTYDRLLGALFFLVVVLACGLTPMQSDTWWQLRAGRDMWSARHVMLTDVYSHTAYGSFWLNHEWLAEILYYLAYRLGGLPAVTLLATALVTGAWAIVWSLTSASSRAKFAWLVFALPAASGAWEPRPHAFSLLLLPLTVLVIVRQRYLWTLPILFALWANLHGGVLIGLLVLSAGIGVRVFHDPGEWRRSARLLGACLAATCATPIGWRFWIEIPRSLARIHQYPLNEWRAPQLADVGMLPFWVLAAAFVVTVAIRRRELARRPAEATLCAAALLLLPLAIVAIRNTGPFVMLAAPALATLVPFRLRASADSNRRQQAIHLIAIAGGAAAVLATLAVAYTMRIGKLRWSPIPESAIAALRQCPDNLYNRYDEGGSLIWFLPERRVFLDGRQDPFVPALVLEHLKMETSGLDYREVFTRHNIRCAYLPSTSPTVPQLARAGWTTLYHDQGWVVLRQ